MEHSLLHPRTRSPGLLPPGSGCIGIVDGPKRAIARIIGFFEAVKALLLPSVRSRPLALALAFALALLPFCHPAKKLDRLIGRAKIARALESRGPASMATGRAAIAFRWLSIILHRGVTSAPST